MKMISRTVLLLTMLLMPVLDHAMAADKIPVFVSIVPQQYFVQQIGKDMVEVQVMVLPGASPATYEPKPKQMAALAKTKLYFAIGVPYENAWLKDIAATNSHMEVVHTDQGISKLEMAAHHHHDEDEHHEEGHHEDGHHDEGHGEGGHHEEINEHDEAEHHDEEHHDHTGLDPHIWLSPSLVKIQARTILSSLQEVDPENNSIYESNFHAFMKKIDQLDTDMQKIFSGKEGLQFMVFHPSWGYFAHDYGLKQIPIEIEGKNPKPAQLKELIEHARENGVKVIFVQPQFSTKSAKVVAREIGGQVTYADPLAEDWMANLYKVAGKFEAALK